MRKGQPPQKRKHVLFKWLPYNLILTKETKFNGSKMLQRLLR